MSGESRSTPRPPGNSIPKTRLHAANSQTKFSFAFQSLLLTVLAFAGCSGKETPAQVQAAPAPALSYIGAWGVKGSDPGQLDKPASVASDGVGNVFIADRGSEFIDKFDWSGTPLLSFQQIGLNHPLWITVDSGAAIYVSDPARASVFVFLPDGDRYRELRVRARPSADNLLSVAVSDDGTVYVLDGSTAKVTQFDSRLRFARTWTVPGVPEGTEVNAGPIVAASDGSLYVGDAATGLIRHLTHEGEAQGEIGPPPNGGRLGDRFAVSTNAIFAMDADGRTVHMFGLDGSLKLSADLAPQLGQGARKPPALAASPRQELLVLDDSAARVLRYRIQY